MWRKIALLFGLTTLTAFFADLLNSVADDVLEDCENERDDNVIDAEFQVVTHRRLEVKHED